MTRKRKRNRYVFTREDCQKGYRAAEQKMMERGWDAYAWWLRHIRGYYRKEKRNGTKESRRAARGR